MAQQRKSVLGRGLDALIPRSVAETPQEVAPLRIRPAGSAEGTATIPMAEIRPNPAQPRSDFDETALRELADSIREKGVIQPITVRKAEDGYQLISGERRFRAAQLAGVTHIPAFIRNVANDDEMLELALIENIQREDLNPMEVAAAYQKLIQQYTYTQEEVAKRVGKDRTSVTNFLRLLKLPQKIQDAIRKGEFSMGHARALLGIEDERTRLRLFGRILQTGMSVRQTEAIVKRLSDRKNKPSKKIPAGGEVSAISTVEEKLRAALGTKVSVRSRPEGKGEIIIDFYSFDDLDRLIELFMLIDKANNS